jgi:hypothetical protein
MLRPRISPCLLLRNSGLVKTKQFTDDKYVGDPINAVKIFNEKEVDEIIITKLRLEEVELAFDQNLFPYKKFEIIKVQLQFFDHFMRGILTNEGLKIYEKSFLKYIK